MDEPATARALTALAPAEVDELYARTAKRLERIVRSVIHAPDCLIEDACQGAWMRLVDHQTRVNRDTAFPWLVTTALHEALKLVRNVQYELSLEVERDAPAELGELGELETPDPRPGPAEACEQHERLSAVRQLPARQQRLLWLRGLGLSYDEIARQDKCTPRTVERQLQRARASLRAAVAE